MEDLDAISAKNMLEGVGTDVAREHEKNVHQATGEEEALKRCFDILDYVSWGNEKGYESWDAIREELSVELAKAGLKRVSDFAKPESF